MRIELNPRPIGFVVYWKQDKWTFCFTPFLWRWCRITTKINKGDCIPGFYYSYGPFMLEREPVHLLSTPQDNG